MQASLASGCRIECLVCPKRNGWRDPLHRHLQLHGVAAIAHCFCCEGHGFADSRHPPAAIQFAFSRDRMGDRSGGHVQRPGSFAVVASRRGSLTGKYQRGETPASGTRAGSEKLLYQGTSEEYADSDRNWATIDAVVRIAKELGATPAQIALSWIADRPGVVAPIVGARTVDQLRNNLRAADLTLSEDATSELEKISAPQPGGYPYGASARGNVGGPCKMGTRRHLHHSPPAPIVRPAGHRAICKAIASPFWPRHSH
jgi:hypothetical protein